MSRTFDVVIMGGGAAGLSCALSLDRLGFQVAVVEQASEASVRSPHFDGRELALTHHTRAWLKDFGVWQHFDPFQIAPLRQADIRSGRHVDGSPAPVLSFHTEGRDQQDSVPLGYLVSHHLIRQALHREVCLRENITVLYGRDAAQSGASGAEAWVRLDDGETLNTRLVIAADGRFSKARNQRGIGAIVHDFRKEILVCRLSHTRPHDDIATQWFDEGQTLAFLPVHERTGDGRACSSLVLTLQPDDIRRLAQMDEANFVKDISGRLQGQLGEVSLVSPRCTYPLKTIYAHRFQTARFALIGDAAVGMHPITAHGFNFGLKGQETLARKIGEGSGDPGEARVLRQFEWAHRRDTMPLFMATNAIATFYTRDTPFSLRLRRAALGFANANPPFRRFVAGVLSER